MARRRAVHPGRILQDQYMSGRELSSNQLGEILKVPANRISDIVRGRRGVSADTALRLARHFRTTPEYWMDLQRDYEIAVTADRISGELKGIRMQRK